MLATEMGGDFGRPGVKHDIELIAASLFLLAVIGSVVVLSVVMHFGFGASPMAQVTP